MVGILKELNVELPCDPTITLVGISPKEMKKISKQMYIYIYIYILGGWGVILGNWLMRLWRLANRNPQGGSGLEFQGKVDAAS